MNQTAPEAASLADLAIAALHWDAARPALEYDRTWVTWGAMADLAATLNAHLARAALPAQAPVALIVRNRPSAVAALIGLIAAGRTVQMVYAFQSPDALIANLDRLDPAAIVATHELLHPSIADWAVQRDMTTLSLSEMRAEALHIGARVWSGAGDSAAPHIHILTSGTTGLPKQIAFSHEFFAAHHVRPKIAASNGDAFDEVPMLLTFPIGNITGMFTFLPTLLSGQRAVLVDRFSLDSWRDWVRRFRPANAGLPPAGIQMILDAQLPKAELSCVRYIGTGAAPLDPEVQRRFEDAYGIPLLISYGATEFGGPVTAMTPELQDQWGNRKNGSVGLPLPGVHLRVVDEDSGAPLPPDTIGLLEVISPRIGPEWIRTADLARIDGDGFLYHMGRADGAIMRGGFKLVPDVIERPLRAHPAISDAGVVARKDHRLGEVPVAALVLRPGADMPSAEAMDHYIRAHLPATHVPVDWRFLDALPRNGSFKLDRPALTRLMA